MGRIFDVLSKPILRTTPRAQDSSAHSVRFPTDAHASADGDVEIPFIEVGGPRTQVEASASVRAAGLPPVLPFAPAARTQDGTSGPETSDVAPTEPRTVAYQSLTQEAGLGTPPGSRF